MTATIPTTVMSTADKAREVARREALAAAWAASAKAIRADLDTEAKQEYLDKGRRVTWDIDDLGRLALPLTKREPYVADIAALLTWVKENHPEQVETVEQVYSTFQRYLLENVIVADGQPVDPSTGKVVAGLSIRPGGQPKTLSITIESGVKREFAAYAEQEVARQLAGEYGEEIL